MITDASEHLQKAKNKAARYCSSAERSPHQVLTKLQLYGLEFSEAKIVLKSLKESNFINEKRFVSAFVNDKFTYNKWGKIKISTELRKHKISSFQIEEGLNIIKKSDYESKINGLIYQKWHQLLGEEIFLIKKKKTCQFVVSTGFESNLVFAQFDQMVKHLS